MLLLYNLWYLSMHVAVSLKLSKLLRLGSLTKLVSYNFLTKFQRALYLCVHVYKLYMISCRPNNIGLVWMILNVLTNKKLTWNYYTDLGKTGREDVDWIHLARVRRQWRAIVNTVLSFRSHKRRWSSWETGISFSRKTQLLVEEWSVDSLVINITDICQIPAVPYEVSGRPTGWN
jgi:hypothetical protein